METQEDQDKELICQDCLSVFIWTAGEQMFFRMHNFSPPKRCKSCRAYLKRKLAERDTEVKAWETQHGRQ
jgi:hypothetical protein